MKGPRATISLATWAAFDRRFHHVLCWGGKIWVLSPCSLSFLSSAHSLVLFFGPLPVSSGLSLALILSAHRIICWEIGGGAGLRLPILPITPSCSDAGGRADTVTWGDRCGSCLTWLFWPPPPCPWPPEQSPGGGLGNWFHLSLILSGAKGKVINIFIYNSQGIKI